MRTIQISDTRIRNRAATWTIGVHVLILLLFLFLKYTPGVPDPYEELGMEVNLGTDADGFGTDQPMAIDDPAAEEVSRNFRAAAARQESGLPDMERSDDPDDPAIGPVSGRGREAASVTTTRQRNRTGETRTREQPVRQAPQKPRYVYSGGTGAGGNRAQQEQAGSSEGNTTGAGDRGVPGGTPGADNYEGSPGNGTGGISHSLRGRSISPARFEAEFREGGRVVVQVTVDREGNILDAKVKSAPNAELRAIALQKIRQARFSKTSSPEPRAFGEVTIVFKARS